MSGPVLLVTGASSGIGEAAARTAADSGYRLVLAARSNDRLASLADSLGGPGRALAVGCDVTVWADQEAAVARALDVFGRIDAVFANAGRGVPRGYTAASPQEWRDMVLTNVLGVAQTARATLPALRASAGHLVLAGSMAGRWPLPGSLYSATKFAVAAMGEALRDELRDSGVRVTTLAPGRVNTPFFDRRVEQGLDAEDIARTLLWVLNQPAAVEVGEVVVRRVCSRDSRMDETLVVAG
jgi:NADP-dependent 3-hydroxy acid dehydrogenase YdfG